MARARDNVSISLKDLFLENYYTPEREAQLTKLSVWPLVAAAYNRTGGKIRVGEIKITQPTMMDARAETVRLTTPEGFNVAMAMKYLESGEGDPKFLYRFGVCAKHTYRPDAESFSEATTSANIRYITAKLNPKSDHELGKYLAATAEHLPRNINHRFRQLVDKSVDKYNGSSVSGRPTIDLPREYVTHAISVMMGGMSVHDIPSADRDVIARHYKKHMDEIAKFSDAVRITKELFSGNKWVIFNGINNGIIVGKLNLEGCVKALEDYESPRCGHLATPESLSFVSFNEAMNPVPLRWYPSLEALPEDMRRDVEIQLVMLKAHVGHDYLLPPPHVHRSATVMWEAIGAAVYSDWGNDCPMYILNG